LNRSVAQAGTLEYVLDCLPPESALCVSVPPELQAREQQRGECLVFVAVNGDLAG
jgi:hypothetical protein